MLRNAELCRLGSGSDERLMAGAAEGSQKLVCSRRSDSLNSLVRKGQGPLKGPKIPMARRFLYRVRKGPIIGPKERFLPYPTWIVALTG